MICIPLLLLTTGCNEAPKDKSRDGDGENIEPPTQQDKKVSELSEEEYKDFPVYFVKKLNSYDSFMLETNGKTTSLGIEQSIETLAIKGEYSYLKNESHSTFVNTVHTAYYHHDLAVASDGGDYSKYTLEDYLDKYGIYPFDNAIEGYTINEGSILSIKKVDSENNYTFELEFDIEKSTNNVKIQMREFGSLIDYPSFNSIKMKIEVKDDFTPVSLELNSKYLATKRVLFEMTVECEQYYVVTYSRFNEQIEIPNLEEIKEKFN